MTSSMIPVDYYPRHVLLEAPRPGMLDWARRRRAEKEAKRLAAAGMRAATRLDPWPDWHVVELPRPANVTGAERQPTPDRTGFLAIGPGGVFAVSVLDHGRARVMLAGDVVQIGGRRPPYIAEARRDARRASRALSRVVGAKVPVIPVLALVGSGPITYFGLPKDCLVTTYRELDRVLAARGERITPSTAAKLSVVARHSATWGDAETYRWYPDGAMAADKTAARR
jgi:hypothetical protein